MILRKKTPPPVTNDSYRRWLRAGCPPFEWFMRQGSLEQEQLAILGDEHQQDLAIAVGYAVSNPHAAEAGMQAAAGDADGDAGLAAQVAGNLIQKIMQGARTPAVQRAADTMSGLGARKRESVTHEVPPMTILGRRPTKP